MKIEDWFSRYQFCAPVGQCGAGTFYLAKDLCAQKHVIIKQYVRVNDDIAQQTEIFVVEVKGLVDPRLKLEVNVIAAK